MHTQGNIKLELLNLLVHFPELTGQGDPLKICYKCKKAGHLSRDCQEHLEETDRATVVMHRKTSDVTKDVPHAETDDVARPTDRLTFEEDDIHEIGEEEKEKLNDLDYLTGNPLPNDILLYAVPVCGPYNALQTYKYRVKMTPGTAKKGKGSPPNSFHCNQWQLWKIFSLTRCGEIFHCLLYYIF